MKKTKQTILISVLPVIALAGGLFGFTGTVSAEPPCDPDFVTPSENVFTVLPTGVDDTANIQCAFDAAVAFGSGAEVHLAAGDFHTAQIVVNDFYGDFTGEGLGESVIMNLPHLYVTPVDMYLDPPSANNPWPSLFAFVNGDFSISDLAIHITGDEGTLGWTIFGIDPPVTELAHAIVILGEEADVVINAVSIEGETASNSLYGYNLLNGILFEGFIGAVPPPLSGSFQVHNSSFRRMASGTPVANVSDAQIKIYHNTFEEVFFGLDAADFDNSSFEFSNNKVSATWYGIDLYNMFLSENVGSSYLVKNNVFRGAYGIVFEQAFGTGNECLLIGNNVQHVTDLGIYLGPNITGCTVVGGRNKTNVFDEGINNILTGVNNMGTGVGPTIKPFMRR
jgi:hypothetical protein